LVKNSLLDPVYYVYFTVHFNSKDYKGIGMVFESSEDCERFIRKLRDTEVDFWM